MEQLFVYERKASRMELLIRIFYSIAISIVLMLYGFFAGICIIIQWFVVLFLGHRNRELSDFIRGYLEYQVHVFAYVNLMTDERPGIMPRTKKIYEAD